MIAADCVVAVFAAASGTWGNFALSFTGARGGFAGFMAALVAALWAYDGWNDLNMVGGEMRDPQRSIPRALIYGVATVAVLYMAVNAAVLYAMPPDSVAKSDVAAADAMRLAVGGVGSGPGDGWHGDLHARNFEWDDHERRAYSLRTGARQKFLPATGGDRSQVSNSGARDRDPGDRGHLLLLVGGAFKELFSLAIFSEWLFYMIATSTVFVFRARKLERPFSAWGYPVVPALFIAAAGVLLYYTFFQNLRNSAIGLATDPAWDSAVYVFSAR